MDSTAAESTVVETGVTEKKEGCGLCFQQRAPGGSLVESLNSPEMGLALFGLGLGMQLVPLTRQMSAESLWQFAFCCLSFLPVKATLTVLPVGNLPCSLPFMILLRA